MKYLKDLVRQGMCYGSGCLLEMQIQSIWSGSLLFSNKSRSERAFRPGIAGIEHLEALVLLSGDPFLPDPTADFDENNYALVDEYTYDVHVASLSTDDAYAPEGYLAYAMAGTREEVVNIIRDAKDSLLASVNMRQLLKSSEKGLYEALQRAVGKEIAADQAELANTPLNNQDKRDRLESEISAAALRSAGLQGRIDALSDEISWLNNYKDEINKAYIRQLQKIRDVNGAADTTTEYILAYWEADSEVIEI
jgi:Skp family chaperone for outer membrane proteins